MNRACAFGLLALVAAGAAAAQDFRGGLSSYNLGDYASALAQWRVLAERDDPDSQAALAFLLFKGLGVERNEAQAAYWYGRAAEQGQPEAQLFLGWAFLEGNGVARDYILAHKWCDIAYSSGAADAALYCRDSAAQRLTPEELRQSVRQVTEWFDRHRPPRRP